MINDNLPEDLQTLVKRLPAKFRRVFREYPDLSEATLQVGRPVTVSWGDWNRERVYVAFEDLVPEYNDIQRIAQQFAGIKEDGRAGIAGTAHRVSAIFDRMDNIVGFTVRVARHFPGALPEDLRNKMLEQRGSILIVGAPGSGKTTLLRAVAASFSEAIGPHLSIIDTSNEIGGVGDTPIEELRFARWHQVPSPSKQPEVIRRAIANHGPLVLILDEVGYHGDVPEVEAAARRGVQVIATVHGYGLFDVIENAHYSPLLGNPDLNLRRRLSRPAFQSMLEVRAKGKFYYIRDLPHAVDLALRGEMPEGERIGAWEPGEPDYPEGVGLTIRSRRGEGYDDQLVV